VDIGMKNNVDLVRWQGNGKNYPLDIISARENATDKDFFHNENNEKRTVFTRKGNFIFSIGSKVSVQFQVLEAMLKKIHDHFLSNFQHLPESMLASGILNGYCDFIPDLCQKAESEDIKWVSTFCRLCNKDVHVAVKKTLINEAENFPVSLVFFHHGHGLLMYFDANFKVRASENVAISG
jgi:hypothetical protein